MQPLFFSIPISVEVSKKASSEKSSGDDFFCLVLPKSENTTDTTKS